MPRTLGFVSLLCLLGTGSTALAAQTIAVPAYFYPGSLWTQMENAAPTVGLAIVNPNSGPGVVQDPNYVAQIGHTRAAGIVVVGYVYTSYGTRSASAVQADVDAYYTWYGVDGIFFDEVSTNCADQPYYAGLNAYVKTMGGQALTILNPGTLIPECFASAGDILLNFEDTYANYLAWTPMGWETGYPPSRFWHLVHGTSPAHMLDAIALSKTRNAGWVYITPDGLPNPWDTLPSGSYWSKELAAVRPPAAPAGCRDDDAAPLHAPADGSSAQNPAYSPDGQTLLFTLFHSGYNLGDSGVYRLALTDGSTTPVLDEPDHQSVNLPGSSWNATTNRITFSSDRLDTDEIWTAAPNGTGLFRVTTQSPPFRHHQEPSFSPDGQWIVFESVTGAEDLAQRGTIWKVKADGTSLTKLVDGPATDTDNHQPNWSPAGSQILFQRRTGASEVWNLYTMAADGSALTQITSANSDTDASWSPDSQWVVYSSDHGDLPAPNLFVVAAGGGTPTRVTFAPVHGDGAASWSPDGKWIAFESHIADDEDSPASLWRIRVPWPFGNCAPDGATCDDANPCTKNDTCSAGACAGIADDGAACDDRNPCTDGDQCQAGNCAGGATPRTGCRLPIAPGSGVLALRDLTPDDRDRFTWKWTRGSATSQSEFGNPVSSDSYALCVFDEVGGIDQLVMAHEIPAGPNWTATAAGFAYRDRDQLSDGMSSVRLKPGSDGRASITVKGGGACLDMAALPLQQDGTVTVQLGNASTCWEVRYSGNTRNSTEMFKARGD